MNNMFLSVLLLIRKNAFEIKIGIYRVPECSVLMFLYSLNQYKFLNTHLTTNSQDTIELKYEKKSIFQKF